MATEGYTADRIADGRYRVRARLGRGGMGQVWRAHDELLDREVAVKEVEFPEAQSERERAALKTRILREARAAARITHPGVVTVFDVVREEDRAFIIMELVPGASLSDLVKREGPLEPAEAARIGAEVLDILRVAHAAGIVHRDVKAGNVLLTPTRSVKLADFGIASLLDETSLTMSGQVFGSPHYMSPEQARGDRAGPATDLWGLGATLFFAVEGRTPFRGEHPVAVLNAVLHSDPPEFHRAGPLAGPIRALLEKDPARRPSVDDAMRMLRDVAGASPLVGADADDMEITGVMEPVADQEPAAAAAPVEPVWDEDAYAEDEEEPEPRERSGLRPVLVGLAAMLVVAAAAVVAAFVLTGPEAPTGQEEPATEGPRRQQEEAGPSPQAEAPSPEAPSPEAEVASPTVSIPPDWETYQDPETGWSLAHPPNWELVTQDETRLDFRDPETGTYIRVDWTDAPGPSPVGAWRSLEESFSASHAAYQRVALHATTYKGHRAAIWEFTFVEGGAELHAADLGFVTDEYGFALYFQTRAEEWKSSEELFETLKAGFQPPA